MAHNMIRHYGEEVIAPRSTPKLEDHPVSAVRNYLLNIFAATLHNGGRSSIRVFRTRHAVVTGDPLNTDTVYKVVKWDPEMNKKHTLSHSQVFEGLSLNTCSERSRKWES
jgi:hypothetical protein